MALKVVPAFLGTGGVEHPVELLRNLLKGLTNGRSGLLNAGEMVLTPSASTMQLTIGPFGAMVLGNASTAQGAYFAYSEAAENIAWPAAAGSARIDTLVLRIIDTQYGTDPSAQGAYWEVVSGTPSGSPVAVADIEYAIGGSQYRPGAYYKVADFRINSGTTNLAAAASITNFTYTADLQRQRMEEGLVLIDELVLTSNGSFVKANYPTGLKVKARVQGGGGGGGGALGGSGISIGGGGGGGGYAEGWYDFSELPSSQAYTIGAGGNGGAAGTNNGAQGGTSTFLNTSATGGGFGSGSINSTGALATARGGGGTASGSRVSLAIEGGTGGYGRAIGGDNLFVNQAGAAFMGMGAPAQGSSSATALSAPSGYGGGGGGGYAAGTSRAGGDGAPGVIVLEIWG